MIRLRHKLLIHTFRLFDQLVLVIAFVGVIYYEPVIMSLGDSARHNAIFRMGDAIGMCLLIVGWIAIYEGCVRYKADRLVALKAQLENLLKATGLASIWLMVICTAFSVKSFNISSVLVFFCGVTMVGIMSRLSVRVLLLSARRSGYNFRYLLIVGASDRARQVADKIEAKPELGYKIVGFVAESPAVMDQWQRQESGHRKVLGLLDNLSNVLIGARVDEIMVCLPLDTRFSDIARIVQHARDLGIVVRLMSNLQDGSLLKNLHVEELEDEYVVTLFREHMLLQLLVKRLIDAALSVVVLILLCPLMLVVAVLIKLTSPGPVFFVQKRVGMNQRQFKLYKFRSMVDDAEQRKFAIAHLNEQDGPAFKIRNDPRTTRFGRILRKTSIDELPQLFNVLCGEMSLVGPRPPLPDEVKCYEWLFRKRLSVKPGVTCIWQVSGRNNVSFDRWMEMDHEYIENWSLWLDMKILLITIPVVLFSRGAS